MLIKLIGGYELKESLGILLPEIGAQLTEGDADLAVTVISRDEDILIVEKCGNAATLTYGGGKARAHRGFAKLVSAMKSGEDVHCEEHPFCKANGAMVDVSRANVLNLDTVKFMMRKMALMGQNQLMLYTEDILEVKSRPYFGYMRGRYSVEEIKELDAYAITLGIELIPCLELLSHMSAVLQWPATGAYKDTPLTLYVGKKETYDFIADVLDAISEAFTSRKLHMGFDETHDMGTGSYFFDHGEKIDSQAAFFEHLKRVSGMAAERGFEPMIWSDMPFYFFGRHLEGYKVYDSRIVLPDNIGELFAGARPVFWAYGDMGVENFEKLFDEHKKIPGETMFAGGVWIWSGFAPLYELSKKATISAMTACKNKGIKEVLATVWTNGSEGSSILTLAGMTWFADIDYVGEYKEESVKKCFADATGGLNIDEFMLLESLEHPTEDSFCATRALCYNDPMIPLIDAHIPEGGVGAHYKKTTEAIRAVAEKQGAFAPAFLQLLRLSELLEDKADFGIKLKAAYDKQDKEEMRTLADLCDAMIEKIKALREQHKATFFTYNKPFGWELHDMRYGMMLMRFETTKERINDYLSGKLDRLEELEETRLPYKPDMEGKFGGAFMWTRHRQIVSPSMNLPI